MKECTHQEQILVERPALESIEGCEDCLKIGGWWVHLRVCLTCGHIGCCDNSPNTHARKHYQSTSHPIIQSAEPNEEWRYCYSDDVAVK
ncbi:MAG: UBP-type zinc finger domain-containing protein [Candidatus Promineifilaceae bacterium]|nr:UBP-type zinc finger domain-containing protein [Candidatus Promineifilaceae bacterium]